MDVVAYLRVSTEGQGDSGLGLAAQRSAIEEAAVQRGWNVVEWISDTASGKSLNREGIKRALVRLENGGPKVLVAAKLDRISRSAIDFLELVRRAERNGWALIMLDPNVDMTEPTGRFTAGVLAQVAELERELISKRTKDALAGAKARGQRLGRPSQLDRDLGERIQVMRQGGMSYGSIAKQLNLENVATPTGKGKWWPASVAKAERTMELDAESIAQRDD